MYQTCMKKDIQYTFQPSYSIYIVNSIYILNHHAAYHYKIPTECVMTRQPLAFTYKSTKSYAKTVPLHRLGVQHPLTATHVLPASVAHTVQEPTRTGELSPEPPRGSAL